MFCFFRTCIVEKQTVSHNRNVRFKEEVDIVNIEKTPEFVKSPINPAILPEKSISNNIENEEPIFTLS